MLPSTAAPAPEEGSVLVRVTARDRGWARRLPTVPEAAELTVTVGHPELLPVDVDDLLAGGYRIAGVAAAHRPVGRNVDVLVPLGLRERHEDWFRDLLAGAERVFDLRLGPVQRVLAAEIQLHLRALATG
ncbi:hypothetical protein [Egicoccus halophilus]|uniref:Uncharacterized protein n=1 Tax=Egicoccus halophilus TaxID=1670830 RepID=A0A8J3ADW9_9ACTN|nr:hypothetical protein [Egicoccus halophilus]GGI05106.1 hypothetical protein GCM10011354_12440 [Egicoccus halophilus]